MKHIIAPSILAADFSKLGEAVEMIDNSAADYVHIDVMDGRFVPNISFGMPIIKSVRNRTKKVFDVHLMIVEPEKYVQEFIDAGADIVTVHAEVSPHLHRTIQVIKAGGAKAGVAINPHTPISVLSEVLNDIDLICVMSVNPGFGGQKFIERTLVKLQQLKELRTAHKANYLLEVDGGVTLQNAASILNAGADILVAGSTVFKSDQPIDTISQLHSLSPNNLLV